MTKYYDDYFIIHYRLCIIHYYILLFVQEFYNPKKLNFSKLILAVIYPMLYYKFAILKALLTDSRVLSKK